MRIDSSFTDEYTDELLRVKQSLGSITCLDYRELSIVEAHKQLGADVKRQVRKILQKTLDESNPEHICAKLNCVREQIACIQSKLDFIGRSDGILESICTYLQCLEAWAIGAELD